MLQQLAKISLNQLINKGIIEKNKEEIFQYGFELLYSNFFILITILLLSILANNFRLSIIFLLFFIPIRFFTGGFHANTYFKCYLFSNLFFIIALILTLMVPNKLIFFSTILLMLFSTTIVYIKAPIEHINHPLTEKKYLKNKKRAYISILFETFVVYIWIVLNPTSRFAFMAACTTGIVAFLMIITKSERRKRNAKITS